MTSATLKPVESEPAQSEKTEKDKKAKAYDLSSFSSTVNLIRDEEESFVKKQISSHINKLIKKYKLDDLYTVVFLYDDYYSIASYHSNRIYNAIADIKKTKNILLILFSDGGNIEPAYLISKTCKKLVKDKFAVSIPRKAKSAATLIALGADEIHMGLLSELGPIDPQIGGFPALGLENALEKISALSAKFPDSSEMFAKYLTANLNMRDLGYYGRITESASQYAERLLKGKKLPDDKTASFVADHFTTHYKDHSFVIDAEEAATILGADTIKVSTPEYDLANEVYTFLEYVDFIYSYVKKERIRYLGSVENGLDINPIKKKEEK